MEYRIACRDITGIYYFSPDLITGTSDNASTFEHREGTEANAAMLQAQANFAAFGFTGKPYFQAIV